MQEQTNGSQAGDGYTAAAIAALLVLTGAMLLAMFTRAEPHPPLEVEPFALGPFLAASLATGAAAYGLVVRGTRFAMAVALLFVLTALVSYGPQNMSIPRFQESGPQWWWLNSQLRSSSAGQSVGRFDRLARPAGAACNVEYNRARRPRPR